MWAPILLFVVVSELIFIVSVVFPYRFSAFDNISEAFSFAVWSKTSSRCRGCPLCWADDFLNLAVCLLCYVSNSRRRG